MGTIRSTNRIKRIDHETALLFANSVIGAQKKTPNSVECIIYSIEQETGVTFEQMCGTSRKREIVYARHYTMYLIKERLKWAWVHIGKLFNKDHSTVIHAVKNVENLMFTNDQYFASLMRGIL